MSISANALVDMFWQGTIGHPLSLRSVILGYPEEWAYQLLTDQAAGDTIYVLARDISTGTIQLVRVTSQAEFDVVWTNTLNPPSGAKVLYSFFGLRPHEDDIAQPYVTGQSLQPAQ